ncbi:MAG: hypothetical protein K2M79_05535 [Muribaculaceae bacterium]|nr:hypothetical protein [Muribaculaceae bacterium]
MNHSGITRLCHSRAALLPALTVFLAAAWVAYGHGVWLDISGDKGFVFPSPNEWLDSRVSELLSSLTLNIIIMGGMVMLCRAYNLLRSATLLYVPLYCFMTLGTPQLMVQLYSGPILCLTVLGCMGLLMHCYRRPGDVRNVFAVFFLLSAGATVQYAFMVYIPVFILGCLQMRILTARACVAMALGVITPWWLAFGLGVATPAGVHLPEITTIFGVIDFTDMVQLLTITAFTVLMTVVALVGTFFKVLAYNAHSRANNGLLSVVTIVTMLAICVDYTNFISYLQVLNVCAALIMARFMSIHNTEKSYITVWTIMTVYAAFYIWVLL